VMNKSKSGTSIFSKPGTGTQFPFLISAIVSTYNSEQYIEACIRDLEAQTIATQIEIIVIDSGSEQNEGVIVNRLKDEFDNIVYIRTERESLYKSWNRGIEASHGKYITNANTDDSHAPDALEKLTQCLEQCPETDLVYADSYWSEKPNDVMGSDSLSRYVKYPEYNPLVGLQYCLLGPHPVWRREVFAKIGLFDPSYKAAGDFEFQMRFIEAGLNAKHVVDAYSFFYTNHDGLSLANDTSLQEEMRLKTEYRRKIPIWKIFNIGEKDLKGQAQAWTLTGLSMLAIDYPWLDESICDAEYTLACLSEAYRLDNQSVIYIQNLLALYQMNDDTKAFDNLMCECNKEVAGEINKLLNTHAQLPFIKPAELTYFAADGGTKRKDEEEIIGINIIGHVSGNLGLGTISRHLIAGLLQRGVPVKILDIDPGLNRGGHDHCFSEYYADSVEELEHPINLFILPPETISNIKQGVPELFTEDKLLAASVWWELTEIPLLWLDALQALDVIVAGSEYIRNIFEFKLSDVFTLKAHHPVFLPQPKEFKRSRLDVPEDAFLYVCGFEPYSDIQRKNPFATIAAFTNAFNDHENVYLIIKINNAYCEDGSLHPSVADLNAYVKDSVNIKLCLDNMDYDEVLGLYDCCDAYVSLHRAEGLGLSPLEAMSLGKPVISTAWSGNLTYMNHTCACMVGYQLVPVSENSHVYARQDLTGKAVWAEASIDEASAWMRRLVEDSALCKKIGLNARKQYESYMQDAISMSFVDELKIMLEQKLSFISANNMDGRKPARLVEENKSSVVQQQQSQFIDNNLACDATRKESNGKEKLTAEKIYENWMELSTLSVLDIKLMAERMGRWEKNPGVHLVVNAVGHDASAMYMMLESLTGQFYKEWGISILSDCDLPEGEMYHQEMVEWIKINKGYIDSVNHEIDRIGADWVVYMPSPCVLDQKALYCFVDTINLNPGCHFIYSDHDYIDMHATRSHPVFKPDISIDFLRSSNYIGELCAIDGSLLREAGGYQEFNGLENYDIALKVIESKGDSAVHHIPDVLYHSIDFTQCSEALLKNIVSAHLDRLNISANVKQGYLPQTLQVEYLHAHHPRVSIIIPTRDKYEFIVPCVDSILEKTDYPDYEIIIIDNQSADPDLLKYFSGLMETHGEKIRVINYDHEFNYSSICNIAASHATGDYLLMLNNDTEVMQSMWLERMMNLAQRDDVGIVGARLLYPGTAKIQHAGIVLGMSGIIDHPMLAMLDAKDAGYLGFAQIDRNVSAVTGACMLVSKSLYNEMNGLDEKNLGVMYSDVDLCLRVTEMGYKIVCTPYANLLHHHSVSIKASQRNIEKYTDHVIRTIKEVDYFCQKWKNRLGSDPYYNRNLSIVDANIIVEHEVVCHWNKNYHELPRVMGVPLSGGAGEYRIRAPFRALERAGYAQCDSANTTKINVQRFPSLTEMLRLDPDVVVFQAPFGDDPLEVLNKYRKYMDLEIIYTLDDLITNMPDGNPFKEICPRDARSRLREGLAMSDRLIVSTEPLRQLCENMIGNIEIVPNCLENEIWGGLDSQRGCGPKPRIGWAGAQQHADDLAFIVDVVKETANEVDWIFFGMCPEEIKPYVSEEHEFLLSFHDYAAKLASLNLDLAIAPLSVHPFNEAKSNLRLLEYGIFGWPVICTDIYPYQNAPVKRVRNTQKEWVNAIRERIYDLDAAYKEGDTLRQWVLDDYMLSDRVDHWRDAILGSGGSI